MKRIFYYLSIVISIFICLIVSAICGSAMSVEQFEEYIVIKEQAYNTKMSPAYVRQNISEETVNPQTGELNLVQTDYVLPGKNGLDLEIKRIYKADTSALFETVLQYNTDSGMWFARKSADYDSSSFYEDRYNLGIGSRFSFPTIEVEGDGKYLHTDSGDVYRLEETDDIGGNIAYKLVNHEALDVTVIERTVNIVYDENTNENSKYIMTNPQGEKYYFSGSSETAEMNDEGRLLAIEDKYGNRILFKYSVHTTKIYDSNNVLKVTKQKKLISEITDTIGRKVTFAYRDGIDRNSYDDCKLGENSEFSVTLELPGSKSLKYEKSEMLMAPGNNTNVIRTKLQRVRDLDESIKYTFTYENALGLKYGLLDGDDITTYNGFVHINEIRYEQYNRIKRFNYATYVKQHGSKGVMQHRKVQSESDYGVIGETEVLEAKNEYTYENTPDGYSMKTADEESEKNFTFEDETDLTNFQGDWIRTDAETYSGSYSFTNNPIGHSQSSATKLTITSKEGTMMQFQYRVSSEQKYDKFIVKVNEKQVFVQSGILNWTPFSYRLNNAVDGVYTIEFIYTKDSSVTTGDDCCYIDNLEFGSAGNVFWEYIEQNNYEEIDCIDFELGEDGQVYNSVSEPKDSEIWDCNTGEGNTLYIHNDAIHSFDLDISGKISFAYYTVHTELILCINDVQV